MRGNKTKILNTCSVVNIYILKEIWKKLNGTTMFNYELIPSSMRRNFDGQMWRQWRNLFNWIQTNQIRNNSNRHHSQIFTKKWIMSKSKLAAGWKPSSSLHIMLSSGLCHIIIILIIMKLISKFFLLFFTDRRKVIVLESFRRDNDLKESPPHHPCNHTRLLIFVMLRSERKRWWIYRCNS